MNQIKQIDGSFFLQNNTFFPIPTFVLDKHKWLNFRKNIQKGDRIEIAVAPIPDNVPNRAIEQLSNYLKILRLSPTDDSSATCHVDVSILTSKIAKKFLKEIYPSIQLIEGVTRQAILPCARRMVPLENNQNTESIPDKAKKSLKESPTDVQGMFLRYLEYEEFHVDKAYYAHNLQLANHLKTQYTKRAQEIANAALKRKSNPLFSLDEIQEMSLLGPYVTKWEYHGPICPSLVTLFATLFPHIEELNLGSCTSVDSIIAELKSFKKLRELRLTYSDATGKTFAHLPQTLTVLNCLGCENLNEKELSWAEGCSIEALDITSTSLDGSCFKTLPRSLKRVTCERCKNLKDEALLGLQGSALIELYITATSLKGTYFNKLPRSLKTLRCSSCQSLEDEAFLGLQGCALEELYITVTSLKGTYFNKLPRSLKTLHCCGCKSLDDEALLGLKGCSLIDLNVAATSLKGTYFKELPRSLRKVQCAVCPSLDDEALLGLEGCPLEYLDISDTRLSGKHFNKLPRSLNYLNCSRCHALNEDTFLGLEGCSLEVVNISYTKLKGSYLKFPSSLRILSCLNCKALDDTILLGLEGCSLEYLDISNTSLSGKHFNKLPRSLRILHCSGCSFLNDEAFLGLEGCSLKELGISDTALEGIHIAKFHKTLKNLSVNGCHRLRATTILKLQESELQSLTIRRTDLMKFCNFFPKTLERLSCSPNDFMNPAPILFQIQRFQSLRYLFIETTTPLDPNHLLVPPSIKHFETTNAFWAKQNGVFKGLYKYGPNMMNHL
jgi:hypothetical protein